MVAEKMGKRGRGGASVHTSRAPSPSLVALAVAVAVVLATRAAGAQSEDSQQSGRTYFVAASDGVDEAVSLRVGSAARAALRKQDKVDWRGPDQRFVGYSDEALERLEKGREKLDKGQSAFVNFELNRAIELLRGAVEDFDAASGAMENPHDLGQALLFLGASQVFKGQRRAARGTFRRLHVQLPHVVPDKNTFNPDVVRAYKRATPRDKRRPRGTLDIRSAPEGAMVYVDYVPRGRAPVKVDKLVQGKHVVRVVHPGAEAPVVERPKVRWRRTTEVEADFEQRDATQGLGAAIRGISPSELSDAKAPQPVRKIAGLLDLDQIGVIAVSPAGGEDVRMTVTIFDGENGERLTRSERLTSTEVGGPMYTAVEELIGGALEQARKAQQTEPVEEPVAKTEVEPEPKAARQEPADGAPVYKKWWFWTAVGAAVAGGAIAGAVVATKDDDGSGQSPSGELYFEF